jgi:hypothetical protein
VTALKYLDVAVVIVAVAVLLALGAPALGSAVGGGAWIVQRGLHAWGRHWTSKQTAPRRALGVSLFEAFGRIWLLGGAIVAAGVLGKRADGLTAALLIFGAYSVAFAIRVVSGPPSARRTPGASK